MTQCLQFGQIRPEPFIINNLISQYDSSEPYREPA
jgi:hypothetical protein